MKIISSSILLVLLFSLFSCNDSKEGEEPKKPPVGNTVSGTQFLNAAAPRITDATRVNLEYGPSVTWESADRIGVFYYADGEPVTEVANRKYSIVKEYAGLTAAVFEAESKLEFSEASSHTLIAVYPYSDNLVNPSRFEVNIPSSQSPLELGDMSYTMVSRMDYTDKPETILMGFELCTPFIMFRLDAAGTEISSEEIDKILIKSASGEILAGKSTYNLLTSLSPSGITESSSEIEITFSEDHTLNQPVEFTFLALPQKDINLTVEFESENYEVSVEYRMEKGILTGSLNNININLAEMIVDGRATVTYTGPLSLSNCYLGQPGRSFSIPVGRAFDVWKEYLDTDLSGTPEAELIWEDNKGLITGTSIDTENFDRNSYINVTTSASKEGNAVVALKLNNTVKWSWHLWIVDYDPENKTHSLNSREFMSRNLGAVNEEPNGFPLNYGLVYQWGRKDPFTGADRQELNGAEAIPMYDKNGVEITPEPITAYDLAFLIENPTSYGSNILYTGSTGEDSWGSESTKTPFDPCPEGWRVPTPKGGVHPWTDFETNSEYINSETSLGYTKGYLTDDGIWYPLPGDRTPDNAKNTFSYFLWQGANGNYWIASANRASQYTMYGSYFKLTSFAVIYDEDSSLQNGYSVRCERE